VSKILLPNVLGGLNAPDLGHVDVHVDDIKLPLGAELDGLLSIKGL
jgi:hypothetical protein